MTWYPGSASVQIQYGDFGVSAVNPGIEYQGTEVGALYCEDRVIAGVFYRVQNVTWNKFAQNWTLVDTTKPAYGVRLTTSGAFQAIFSAIGTSPFTIWTVTATFGGAGQIFRTGTVTAVPSDGSSSVPVTFSSPIGFTPVVILTVSNNFAANPWQLSAYSSGENTNGFTLYVSGGPPGSTTSINYFATGMV